MIKNFFSPPVFDNEEDNFRANFINDFAWVMIAIAAVFIFIGGINLSVGGTDFILIVSVVVIGISLYILHKREINISGSIIVVLGWLELSYQAYRTNGAKDVVVIAYIGIALLASIIINWQAGGIVILASIGAIWILAVLETNHVITPRFQQPLDYSRDLSFVFIAITVLVYLSMLGLRNKIARAQKNEYGFLASNKKLQELNLSHEDRIINHVIDLGNANQRNEKWAKQFEVVAQVARAATTNENLNILFPRLVSLISEQLGFYHTGIFLLDESRTYAVLRAANSDGGKRMLEREHKLQIGQTGMVGIVSATGNTRIAQDVESDAVYFNNPDLPNTHSEIAIPLRVAGAIIGVLDVQSTEINAFQQTDITILSTLTDQIAITIQNSRSYELLQETQKTSDAYLDILQSEEASIGYRVTGDEIHLLAKPLSSAQINNAVQNKKTVVESRGDATTLVIPIRLREDVIGVIEVRTATEHEWDGDEVDIAEAISDRLSLALESSLLLKSTQKRAELERITAEISSKIGATTQFEAILRVAAEELSRVLGGSDVLVQINNSENFTAEA